MMKKLIILISILLIISFIIRVETLGNASILISNPNNTVTVSTNDNFFMVPNITVSSNTNLTSVTIIGDSLRFNNVWQYIGFPLDLKP